MFNGPNIPLATSNVAPKKPSEIHVKAGNYKDTILPGTSIIRTRFSCAPRGCKNAKTYFVNVFNIIANVAPPDPLEQPEYCRLCIAIIVVRRLKCKMCEKDT